MMGRRFVLAVFLVMGIAGGSFAEDVLKVVEPINGATKVTLQQSLVWKTVVSGDTTEAALTGYTYDVWLGTGGQETQVATGLPLPLYTPSGAHALRFSTAYFWRVRAVSGDQVISGDLWRFTTKDPTVNEIGELTPLEPIEGAKDIRPTQSFRWSFEWNKQKSVPGTYRCAVRLGASPSTLQTVATNLSDWLFSPTNLGYEKIYYWQVVVTGPLDEAGAVGSWYGPIWKFTTGPEKSVNYPLDGGGGCDAGMGKEIVWLLGMGPLVALFLRRR